MAKSFVPPRLTGTEAHSIRDQCTSLHLQAAEAISTGADQRRGPPGEHPEEVLVETTTLDEAMGAIVDWPKELKLDSLGIASLGPVGLNMIRTIQTPE
ncbi:hypothetical protein PRNP1_014866 [Phytophthora ramorum]